MRHCCHLSFRSNMCISERDLYTYMGYLFFFSTVATKSWNPPYACGSSEARFVEFKQGQFCTHVPEIQTTSEYGHRVLTLPPPKSVLTLTRLDASPCRTRRVDSKTGFRTPPKYLTCAGVGRPTQIRLPEDSSMARSYLEFGVLEEQKWRVIQTVCFFQNKGVENPNNIGYITNFTAFPQYRSLLSL